MDQVHKTQDFAYRIGEKDNADLDFSAVFNFQTNFGQVVDTMKQG